MNVNEVTSWNMIKERFELTLLFQRRFGGYVKKIIKIVSRPILAELDQRYQQLNNPT